MKFEILLVEVYFTQGMLFAARGYPGFQEREPLRIYSGTLGK
jgi:hypothetical protein